MEKKIQKAHIKSLSQKYSFPLEMNLITTPFKHLYYDLALNSATLITIVLLQDGNLPSLFFSMFTRRDCQTFIHVTMQ